MDVHILYIYIYVQDMCSDTLCNCCLVTKSKYLPPRRAAVACTFYMFYTSNTLYALCYIVVSRWNVFVLFIRHSTV